MSFLRRIDRRAILLVVPVLALVVLLVLSTKTTPGAPALPTAGRAAPAGSAAPAKEDPSVRLPDTAVPTTGAGRTSAVAATPGSTASGQPRSPSELPTKVPADAPVVTAPRNGNESPAEIAAADRAATIRAYRGEAQPWESTVPAAVQSTGAPGLPGQSGTTPVARGATAPTTDAALSEEVGGGEPVGPFLVLVGLVAAISAVAARTFRRRSVTPAVIDAPPSNPSNERAEVLVP